MNKLVIYSLLVSLVQLVFSSLKAQDFKPLVEIAWQNNSLLKSKNFQLESAAYSLKEAKAMFGPDIKFGSQYTLAQGGRSIDFPVGDLLNPVYNTLNLITQTNSFPQISNVHEKFLPNNFYDARFRISQPVFYPDLAINQKLKSETIKLKDLEIKAFKRQISRDVMSAWFQMDLADNANDIYLAAETLLGEAKRTTQSLIRNGVALPSALSRIETQLADILAHQIEAKTNVRNAAMYLRFILGVDENVGLPELTDIPDLPTIPPDPAMEREEIKQIKQSMALQNLSLEKDNAYFKPRIGAQLDVGSQDFDFGLQPYALIGLNVEFNIYDSNRHKYRKDAVKADIMASNAQMNHVSNQMTLLVNTSKANLISALKQADTYYSRINDTKKIYEEVLKKYKEGIVGYLELLDAQTQVTQTELQHLVARNNAWLRWVEYIYATATFHIE